MRHAPLLLLPFLLACPTESKDSGGADTTDTAVANATLCGTVERGDAPSLPPSVEVWTLVEGVTPCSESSWDSGGSWEDWRDKLMSTSSVNDAGAFYADVPAGEYGVWAEWDGYWACTTTTVTETACAEATLVGREYISADAPNVYLYPEAPRRVQVKLSAPNSLTVSDPVYPRGGWNVLATPGGELRTVAGPRDYLFYEQDVDPARFEREEGWCVSARLGQATVEDAMADLGFNEAEIADFAEYWDAVFPTPSGELTITPLLDRLPPLGIDPAPDTLLRAWFKVSAGCTAERLPELTPTMREGFVATEWGVLLDSSVERVPGWQIH